MNSDPSSAAETRAGVAAWFDRTYARLGFGYLRPPAAYPIFLQLMGVRAGQHLLDVACGPGLLLKPAQAAGLEVSGVDLSAAALELARAYVPEATLLESSAEQLGFPAESFDRVTCIAAIERFVDRRAALKEMRRVGRADAVFCFMVRNARTLVWRLWRETLGRRNVDGHQDALDLEEWRALFVECGFRIEAVYMDQWFRQRVRRVLRGLQPPPAGRAEPVAHPLLPLRYANEFIFILRKS
jgi:ubiquinone/menaquinone biosynthesis C-methylase UbiE